MSPERKYKQIDQLVSEYKTWKNGLEGFDRTDELAEEFNTLESYERILFTEGRILEKPQLLMGMDVTISHIGEDNVFHGNVQGIERDGTGNLKSIILAESFPKLIPFKAGITHIAPYRKTPIYNPSI